MNKNLGLLQLGMAAIFLFCNSGGQAQTARVVNDTVEEMWVRHYAEPESINLAMDLTVDRQRNVYVTGSSATALSGDRFATLKYSSEGVLQWSAVYDYFERDVPRVVRVDNAFNVYVTGFSLSPSSHFDYATIKYSPDGVEQWVTRYDGPLNWYDEPRAMELDEAGNIYVSGVSRGDFNLPLTDAATIKYRPDGTQAWVARYPNVWVIGMAVEPLARGGSIYVTGYTLTSTSADFITIKYDSVGNQLWAATFDGAAHGWDRPAGMTLDHAGNVIVTGQSVGTNGGPNQQDDIVTIKYTTGGVEEWVARFNGSANNIDRPSAIAADRCGNVLITGQTINCTSGMIDYVTLKYSSTGDELWQAYYTDPNHFTGIAQDIAVDSNCAVYITGTSATAAGAPAFATVKYDAGGTMRWTMRHKNAGMSIVPIALVIDSEKNVYVTSQQTDQSFGLQFTTVKYLQDVTTGVSRDEVTPDHFVLAQNYPNPLRASAFNPLTKIKFSIHRAGVVTLRVYDVLGREVKLLLQQWKPAGKHAANFDASGLTGGVYYYRLQWEGLVQTRKMILVR